MRTTKTTTGPSTKLPTPMADLGCVVRLDSLDRDAIQSSLVLDERLQLIKTPVTNPIVHSFASSVLTDSFEVFHDNLIAIESGNNLFTDVVVNPSHPTSFSSAQLPEKLFGRTSAFRLKLGTQISTFPFDLFDFRTVIEPAVRTDSEVVYSEVNAQNGLLRATALLSGSNLFRECEQEKTPMFFIYPEQAFFDVPTEIIFVAARDSEDELLPAFEQSQDQCVAFEVSAPVEVIADTCLSYDWFGLGLFDHATSLADTTDSELRWQFEPFPDSVIDGVMQFEVFGDVMFPSIINTELERFSVGFDSGNYLSGWVDSDRGSYSCSHNYNKTEIVYKAHRQMSSDQWQNNKEVLL